MYYMYDNIGYYPFFKMLYEHINMKINKKSKKITKYEKS